MTHDGIANSDPDFDATHDLRVERVIRAPAAVVWRCLVEAELLRRWWVPAPVVLTELVMDATPGGRFFSRMQMPDGSGHTMEMMILRADHAARLVFTDLMTAGFRPVAKPMFGFVGILALSEAAKGTIYTATARHVRAENAARHAEMGFAEGWGAVADQLAALAPTV